tara:strand:+ start:77 stop:1174 length:1098 start_codon:yes stop_codon:yes gene_type:complete
MKSILEYAKKKNIIANLIPLAVLSKTNIRYSTNGTIFQKVDPVFEIIEQYKFIFLAEALREQDLKEFCKQRNVNHYSFIKAKQQIKELEEQYNTKADYNINDNITNHMLCAWVTENIDNLHVVDLPSGKAHKLDDTPVLNLECRFFNENLHSSENYVGVSKVKAFVFGKIEGEHIINQAFLGLFQMLEIAKQLPEIFKVKEIDRHIFQELDISEITYEVSLNGNRLLTLTDFPDESTKKQFRLDLLEECIRAAEEAEEHGTGKVLLRQSKHKHIANVYGKDYSLLTSSVTEGLLETLRNDIVISQNLLKIKQVNDFLRQEKRPQILTEFKDNNPENWFFMNHGIRFHMRDRNELNNLLSERHISI